MAREIEVLDISVIASHDFSASQWFACALDNTGKAALPSTGGAILGVIQNKPAVGQSATVRIYGETKAVTNSTGITTGYGTRIGVDSAGKFQTDTTGGHYAVGISKSTTTDTNGALCTILLLPQGKN